jgi:hypothetical protein
MSSFQCHVDLPTAATTPESSGNSAGVNQIPLSVGKIFFISCRGDWPADLKIENLHLELPPEQKYTLKLQEFVRRDVQVADLKVVSYLTGNHNLEKIALSDGTQTLELTPISFQVQSVLDPQNQKPEPYGPMGPLGLGWPLSYWIILASVLVLSIGLLILKIWNFVVRKKWLAKIKIYDSPHTPLSQFHSELRSLQRAYSFFGEGDRQSSQVKSEDFILVVDTIAEKLKIFLIRELRVQALNVPPQKTLAELKKYHPLIYRVHQESIRRWFAEIDKLKKVSDQKTIQSRDLRQLLKDSRDLAEQIQSLRFSQKEKV